MSKKVLIFDDHELITEVLGNFLKQKGLKITTARTMDAFRTALCSDKFDTIITDASITDVPFLKANSKNTQIIFISGHTTQEFIEENNIPGSIFIKKPFSLNSIFAHLNNSRSKEASKILVVDDQDYLREMLVDYLKAKGFSVKEAKNGREAVQLAIEFPFDGILMDIRMPVLDGVVALQEMQKVGIQTPVFLMSGYGDVASAEDAQALGAKDFLAKPFKLETASSILEKELA
jgi:DNA-binding NtrC family response regulator